MRDKVTIEEINKWTEKMEKIVNDIEVIDSRGELMLTNLRAYISDSKHFLGQGDYVRSFEAIVWAWAIFEICVDLDVFSCDRWSRSNDDE